MIDLTTPHDLDPDELDFLRSLKGSDRAQLAADIRDQLDYLASIVKAAGIGSEDVKAGAAISTKIQPGPSGLDEWIN